jgi:hypothetical protein
MEMNGLAALRCWPVSVALGNEVYSILPQPALAWFLPIVDQDWLGIVPGLLDPADRTVDDLLAARRVSVETCAEAARDAVSTATGMPWWSATGLALAVIDVPELAAELLLNRIDIEKVSIGGLVQTAYRLLVRDADKKQRNKIDSQLRRPPQLSSPTAAAPKRYDPHVAADLFDQMARSRGLPT